MIYIACTTLQSFNLRYLVFQVSTFATLCGYTRMFNALRNQTTKRKSTPGHLHRSRMHAPLFPSPNHTNLPRFVLDLCQENDAGWLGLTVSIHVLCPSTEQQGRASTTLHEKICDPLRFKMFQTKRPSTTVSTCDVSRPRDHLISTSENSTVCLGNASRASESQP